MKTWTLFIKRPIYLKFNFLLNKIYSFSGSASGRNYLITETFGAALVVPISFIFSYILSGLVQCFPHHSKECSTFFQLSRHPHLTNLLFNFRIWWLQCNPYKFFMLDTASYSICPLKLNNENLTLHKWKNMRLLVNGSTSCVEKSKELPGSKLWKLFIHLTSILHPQS